jgi:pyruvate formate lyase activating enzyme
MSKSRTMETLASEASPERIAHEAVRFGCRSIAFTYNDPVIFHEYAIDAAQAAHEHGLKTVAVTAGEMCSEPRAEFYQYMDAANVDLKAFTESFYYEICASSLEPVLETLLYIKHETTTWLEITTLLIPGLNDSDEELDCMTSWVVRNLGPEVPHHFSAFHPDFRMRDRPHTPADTLRRAREIARKNGARYAYVGNVHDPEADSTRCAVCKTLLIGRDWYRLTHWSLSAHGGCPVCGTPCAGIWEEVPGTWGPRRLPILMG